jgi:uncharacterized protein
VRARRLWAVKQELLKCAAEHGARNLRVFGSVARGDDRPDSDVDLLRPEAAATEAVLL